MLKAWQAHSSPRRYAWFTTLRAWRRHYIKIGSQSRRYTKIGSQSRRYIKKRIRCLKFRKQTEHNTESQENNLPIKTLRRQYSRDVFFLGFDQRLSHFHGLKLKNCENCAMTGKTDDELVQSLKETDELRFFDELVNRHAHKVRSMVYPIVLNNSDADDVTQEIFLRAYRGIGKFNGRSSFSTWLQRIAMNTTMTFLRKAAKHKHAMFDEHIDTENTSPTPSQSVISKEANIKIERALASLSPPLRAAITLTAIEGMSVKDAARTSGCLAATMYWRVHEARRILRTKLQEH